MNCGIYRWESPSGKYYIGQAVNLKRRKNEFLNFNLEYTSKGSAIDNARNKYNNKESWKYEVLDYCNKEELDDKEKYYINLFDTYNFGYNSTIGGDGTKGCKWRTEKQIAAIKNRRSYKGENNPNFGKHHTEEARKAMSEKRKGKPISDEHKKKMSKPIIQLTLNDEFVKEWDSITDAANNLKCDKTLIMRVCKGIKKSAKGFHFRYKN